MEKAWAKLYGSYERIERGLCRDALRDLTGAPTKTVFTEDQKNPGKMNDELMVDLEFAL